ncbi:MAG: hypothetical protein JEZ11_14960 [Desulfobacterales bacterium]|nr:hypothetical protein [Desulfobacterales bacterium]
MKKRVFVDDENYFGHCGVTGHECHTFNLGRENWMCCDECKIRWIVGGNLFSSWCDETEDHWKRNAEKYGPYTDCSDMMEFNLT